VTLLTGFDDLKPRDILAWESDGTVLIRQGDGVRRMQLQVQPTGCLSARDIQPAPIDQQGERQRVPVSARWASTDQGSHI
jgi:hypothetical protein